MGIYRVQSDGYAPAGLKAGDQVVTGGGTYVITKVNDDGTYDSNRIRADQTTHNYQGTYDLNPVYSSGIGSLRVTNKNMNDVLSQHLGDTVQQRYTPVVNTATKPETLSFQDAVKLAEQVIGPQYETRFQDSAKTAAQRLEKAGLYDTLYGQSLAADAERDLAAELNSAIYTLAMQLSQASQDQALDILKLAVSENQFASDTQSGQGDTALKYLYQIIKDLEDRQLELKLAAMKQV